MHSPTMCACAPLALANLCHAGSANLCKPKSHARALLLKLLFVSTDMHGYHQVFVPGKTAGLTHRELSGKVLLRSCADMVWHRDQHTLRLGACFEQIRVLHGTCGCAFFAQMSPSATMCAYAPLALVYSVLGLQC
ncbi:hypothetical protein COO60DRAFT_1550863 [Scenedesmus sp. NREL 46B-D3]|nr:hypothetical protein COO60DRAFT_1550863 [Scenedesmus sp. NREL 46B-D3]